VYTPHLPAEKRRVRGTPSLAHHDLINLPSTWTEGPCESRGLFPGHAHSVSLRKDGRPLRGAAAFVIRMSTLGAPNVGLRFNAQVDR